MSTLCKSVLCKPVFAKPSSRQRGVALITALLIVALVTVVAVAMVSRQQLDIRRTGNLLAADQSYLFALAGETWAKQILLEDQQKSTIDSLTEDWATPLPSVPVDRGSVGGRIEDLQGRFNLNNLIDEKGEAQAVQLKALQTILEEAGREQEEIQFSPFMVNRVLDWIDPDPDPAADGAEDLDYLNLDVPYRSANRLMVSPSELAAISGFSLAEVNALLPLVSTLPEPTPVNINTASQAVLMSLHEDISAAVAADLIEQREDEAFAKVEDAVKQLKDDYEITLDPKRISVGSDYFLLSIDATIGQTELRLYSVLRRKSGQLVTLRRSIGIL